MEARALHRKVIALLRVYALICVGVIFGFLILWAIAATEYAGASRWTGGELTPYWKYYEEELIWYSVMSFSIATTWVLTTESSNTFRGRTDFIMRSKKFDRCCLVAFPFVGLGLIFGKSIDFVENFIAQVSLLGSVLIFLRMIAKSFYRKG
jgi:hypothetical protein